MLFPPAESNLSGWEEPYPLQQRPLSLQNTPRNLLRAIYSAVFQLHATTVTSEKRRGGASQKRTK